MRRFPLVLGAVALIIVACSRASTSSNTTSTTPSAPRPVGAGQTISGDVSLANSPPMVYPSNAPVGSPDPRIGLKAGESATDAGVAAFNMKLISNSPAPMVFTGRGATGSDLAFSGNYAIQGNYRGLAIWDISNPRTSKLVSSFLCPTAQGDPTVFRNLLFVSGESQGARNDCGTTPITDSVSMDRFRGVRIFNLSDMSKPRLVMNVQTCRGSHTNTIVQDPADKDNIYIYVSGSSVIRSSKELANCQDAPAGDSTSARFRIEVIKVPLKNPERSAVVNSPHLLADLSGRTVHAPPPSDTGGRGGRAGRGGGIGQSGCHDITAYPNVGYAGGACGGYGLLFDIRDPKNPKRLKSVADSNMSFWHSATFSNDGSKLLFSDEWGGGGAARCRAADKLEWGGNAIFTVENGELKFKSYYKMPAPQTDAEICTAHNGSLIPVPGRDIMVQAFYQGGATVFDWTDPAKPIEIGFFDRGPGGGYWSTYWYNGVIVSSDETRGLDVHELTPGPYLSQNEIDAAKTVRYEQFNSQEQPHTVWPPSFALARAFLDQMERNKGLPADRIASIRKDLDAAERMGSDRNGALSNLASQVGNDLSGAADKGRTQMLINALKALSGVRWQP